MTYDPRHDDFDRWGTLCVRIARYATAWPEEVICDCARWMVRTYTNDRVLRLDQQGLGDAIRRYKWEELD